MVTMELRAYASRSMSVVCSATAELPRARGTISESTARSSNAAVLFVDHQTGLANGVQTQSPPEFINNVRALVTIAQIYKLPSIITTSSADGPNGPIMPVVAQGLPEATT